jgi:hypothetical protein
VTIAKGVHEELGIKTFADLKKKIVNYQAQKQARKVGRG